MDIRSPKVKSQFFFWNSKLDTSATGIMHNAFSLWKSWHFRRCQHIFERVRAFSRVVEHSQACSSVSKRCPAVLSVVECSRVFPSVFERFQAYLSVYEHVWTLSWSFKRFRACPEFCFENLQCTFRQQASGHNAFWNVKSGHSRPQHHVICSLVSYIVSYGRANKCFRCDLTDVSA